jgi:hypothetical protein
MHAFMTALICALAIAFAAAVTVVVVFGNMMSDAPTKGFQDGGLIVLAWVIALGVIAARVF